MKKPCPKCESDSNFLDCPECKGMGYVDIDVQPVTPEMQAAWVAYKKPGYSDFVGTGPGGCRRLLCEAFMAGWTAAKMSAAIDGHSPAYDTEHQRDWTLVQHKLHNFALMRNLPVPELIFHPKWRSFMYTMIAPAGHYVPAIIKFRFGRFGPARHDVFEEM